MEKELPLQTAYNDVLQKIGRNLLSFQRAEHLLKDLLKLGGLAVRSDAPEESFGDMAKRVEKMTMGGLTTLFTETHCSPGEPVLPDLPEGSNGTLVAMNFSFDFGETGLAERQESFATLVKERNNLVHHLLPGFDQNSLESCSAMAADLDRQHELVSPEIKRLQEDYSTVRQNLKILADFMASPDGVKLLISHPIQQHPLIGQFVDVARKNPDPEEWISLNTAAGCITGFPPEEISTICANFGQKSLTSLMIASQLFDIHLESARKHHRVLYRLKQDAGPAAFSSP